MKSKKQIELLREYNVQNYTIGEDGKITINGSLDLSSLTSAESSVLHNNVKQLQKGY